MILARGGFGFAYNGFNLDPAYAVIGHDISNSGKMEFYSQQKGWEIANVTYPVDICYNCIAYLNSSTVISTGGGESCHIQNATAMSYLATFTSLNQGPSMKLARMGHGCTRIKRNANASDYVHIVAGGVNPGNVALSSVEIFDPLTNNWSDGVSLPFGISSFAMTEDLLGGVLVVGGKNSSFPNGFKSILHLPHAGLDASWTVLQQTLSIPQLGNAAIVVPGSLGIF